MPNDVPDSVDRKLLFPVLDELIGKPLKELGDQSCRDLLSDIVQEAWYQLAEKSCLRNNRPLPIEDDAINAYRAIKAQIVDQPADSKLPELDQLAKLTFPELRQYFSRIRLKYWIVLFSVLFATVASAFGIGAWFARIMAG